MVPRFGFFPSRLQPVSQSVDEDVEQDVACRHDAPIVLPKSWLPITDISFSADSLATIRTLGQVDRKYIACVIPSKSKDGGIIQPTLGIIDQHAADERASLENILRELCEGFLVGNVVTEDLSTALRVIVLSREDADVLNRPGVLEVFSRWGLLLELPAITSELVQVTVKAVPRVLSTRLKSKETAELTRLIKLHLHLLDQSLGEVLALLTDVDTVNPKANDDWGRVLRWMPREMLELAKSKACRGPSMLFGQA